MQQSPRCLPPIYVFPRLRQLFMEGSSTRLVGANARRDIDTLAANTHRKTRHVAAMMTGGCVEWHRSTALFH